MTDIFISYSRSDQQWVKQLASALESAGYDVWWDTQLLAGDDFQHKIPEVLEQAKCVIVIWSKHSVTRKWVRAEASRGDDRNVLIPVKAEDTPIPMPFNLLHTENMCDWNGTVGHDAFQRLLRAVQQHCQQTVIPESPREVFSSSPLSRVEQEIPVLDRENPSGWLWALLAVPVVAGVVFFMVYFSSVLFTVDNLHLIIVMTVLVFVLF